MRSGNLYSPDPEEANRKLTGILTDFHFAPTEANKNNLLREGYPEEKIFITGNTVIDALKYTVKEDYIFDVSVLNKIDYEDKRIILLTSHRRENIGRPMENIFSAIDNITKKYDDVEVIFPIHLNPKVRDIAKQVFKNNEKVHMIEPLDYEPFINLMAKSYLKVTDSGAVQEEAPSLGKPVLVVREETERPEGIEWGTAKLVGTRYQSIFDSINLLLSNEQEYIKMAKATNPYGAGDATDKIVKILLHSTY